MSEAGGTRGSVARGAIEKPLFTWLLIIGMFLGGIWGFFSLGRLEDPAFTIKQATVVTLYPGASAADVAREISEPLEAEIQGMAEVDFIRSTNRPGFSLIEVEIKSTYPSDTLPAIWTKLRHRVGDAAAGLPSGASTPQVNDTFGDVFGIYFAITAPGYTDAELHDIATFLQRELLATPGVADVAIAGLPDEAIFIEPIPALILAQGASPDQIIQALATSDSLSDSGADTAGGAQTLIESPEGYGSVEALRNFTFGLGGRTLTLRDFATIYRGREARPQQIIRFNGMEAFTLGVAGIQTENIVDVGKAVDARLAELAAEIPAGVELKPIYQQHVVVEQASNDFLVNLASSVAIVIVVLTLFMGWRAALVVGVTLTLTVIGTVLFMKLFDIEMERISLGALIIAMGMLVDNAIVIAEGMQMRMLSGQDSRKAAAESGERTQMPLLGATVIGIMAFAGIGLSSDATGEFLFSLFAVISISLLLSWVMALTVTPLLAHYVFKRDNADLQDLYAGRIYTMYRGLLARALKARGLVVGALFALTVICYAGFGFVKQSFFPDSNTPLLFAHLKLPQGAEMDATSEELKVVEAWLMKQEEVVSVSAFVGQGGTRFMLTYAAKFPDRSYGHLIIRTESADQLDGLRARLDAFAAQAFSGVEFRTERLAFGPGSDAPIQLRLSGPDGEVLRSLAEEAAQIFRDANPELAHVRVDWREQEIALAPLYAPDRAETAGVTREQLAQSLKFATDGVSAGVLREGDRLIPITIRLPRDSDIGLGDLVIWSPVAQSYVPIAQITDGFAAQTVDTLIKRRDRRMTIGVSADVPSGASAAAMRVPLVERIDAFASTLPTGYVMEWGGEHESSTDAQASLGQQLPLSLLIMVLITVFLFGALRQTLVIWLLVPMCVNGATLALLGTGLPFTFTALLGLLSLSGMLIKNGIVLVEEIDLQRAEGVPFDKAVSEASVSRLRPIMLAAATTILGMAPLLPDAFFASMAVTIMGGLAFATVLTLIAAPVFYSLIVRRDAPAAT